MALEQVSVEIELVEQATHVLVVVVTLPTVVDVDYVKNPNDKQAVTHKDELLVHAEQNPLFG